jgi:hypothetical protein
VMVVPVSLEDSELDELYALPDNRAGTHAGR